MAKIKVALILYTSGLQYDDRIRKEILSICKQNKDVEFEIFALLPENKAADGVTDYGIKYHQIFLKSREKYPSASHLAIKAYDFFKTVRPRIKSFDVIWCADVETFLFPLLLNRNRPVIWDLHELPMRFTHSKIMRSVFKYIEKKTRIIYHANQDRINYLHNNNIISQIDKHIAIRNYPEQNISNQNVTPDDTYLKFCDWVKDYPCAYIQGISGEDRRAVESVSAALSVPNMRAVVVGSYTDNTKTTLLSKYGNELYERVYFAGKVPQIQTKLYMSKCKISLIFYNMCSINNSLCEPNRMFQSIMMGLPVVVGCNKPMKEIVEKHSLGIVLNNDGENVEDIINAIQKISSEYDYFKNNLQQVKDLICWNSQDALLYSTFINAIKN